MTRQYLHFVRQNFRQVRHHNQKVRRSLRPKDKHGPVKLKLIQKLNNFTDATISAKRGAKKIINQKLSTLIQVVAATALVNTVINVKPTNAAVLTTFEAASIQNSTYYNQFGNNDDNG